MGEPASQSSAGPATETRPIVALVGNPNTGKTSVFNLLTGARRRVGNYPGVTVDTVASPIRDSRQAVDLLDLPGTYSLAARSPDEMLVVDCLLGRLPDTPRPDAVVVVVDASNLDRNLFLTMQVLEMGVPVVVALNMVDVAERGGIRVDAAGLAARLGVPVVPLVARLGSGRQELVAAIESALISAPPLGLPCWPAEVDREAASLREAIARLSGGRETPPAPEVRRCLVDIGGYIERRLLGRLDGDFAGVLVEHRGRLAAWGANLPSREAEARYCWIEEVMAGCVRHEHPGRRSPSDRVDDVVTHRVFGAVILVVVMGAMFVSVFAWAAPLMHGIETFFAVLANGVRARMGPGVWSSFLADGVVGGVGGVLTFLPQILVLFALITVLEDCGYLARAAFLMDRIFRTFGLGGRSFVPLLSAFACAIPGIMAARTVESPRERLVTMLVSPLMPCSARIPIYALLIGVFVPERMVLGFLPLQGLVFTAMYFFGMGTGLAAALVLRKTLLRGEDAPFLLELPGYKAPSLRTVVMRAYDRGKSFLTTAGTIILALSIVAWALLYFPRPPQLAGTVRAELAAQGVTDAVMVDHAVAGAYLRQSYFGRAGRAIEPAVRPLGWDWKIGMSVLAAFPAREVVISTLGIAYNLGPEEDAASDALRDKLRAATWPDGRRIFTLPVALSILVFFALCCQCQATLAVIKRETRTWRWPLVTFAYMTVLAYVAALIVYQVGIRLA